MDVKQALLKEFPALEGKLSQDDALRQALRMVEQLNPQDTVLFLLSGGGSALFEAPLIPGGELQEITSQLLACGADIVEINTIRKRLSRVKGGRFARACAPASSTAPGLRRKACPLSSEGRPLLPEPLSNRASCTKKLPASRCNVRETGSLSIFLKEGSGDYSPTISL